MKLREIAHSRTGDKGDTSNISLIAYDEKDYDLIVEQVTATRVREHFKEIALGDVTRYELPAIGALNFVLRKALGGGVTRSLALDAHGKGLSSALLDLDIEPSSDQQSNNPQDRGSNIMTQAVKAVGVAVFLCGAGLPAMAADLRISTPQLPAALDPVVSTLGTNWLVASERLRRAVSRLTTIGSRN